MPCPSPQPRLPCALRLTVVLGLAALASLALWTTADPAQAKRAGRASPSPVDQAREHAQLARAVYEKGQYGAAAELYRKAFRLDPSKPDYLYGIGKAEQKAGRWAQARTALEQLLAILPADDPLAERARKALAEVVATQTAEAARTKGGRPQPAAQAGVPAPPQPPAAQPPATQPTPAPASPIPADPAPVDPAPAAAQLPPAPTATGNYAVDSGVSQPRRETSGVRWPTWSVAGASVLGVVGAVVFGGLAMQADSDADAWRVPGSRAFDPARISQPDAQARLDDINGKWTGAAVCGGVAVTAGVAAVWMWWTDRPLPRTALGPSGAQLAWTF